jgi:uracil-DNA glycosylase family 4
MARKSAGGCWSGKDDPGKFIPGIPEVVPRARSLKLLFADMACCTRCDLALERTQVVRGVGPARARLMLIGEAPGAKEDLAGVPFVGSGGRLLDQLLERGGVDRSEVFVTNIAACRPPQNRPPRPGEIAAHAPWLEEQIRLVRPEVITTLGRVSLTYFIPKAKITQMHGQVQRIERDGRQMLLLPTYHPAAALRNRELIPDMEQDFMVLVGLLTA